MTTIYFMMLSGMSMMLLTQKHLLTLVITIEFSLLASLLLLTTTITTTLLPPFSLLMFLPLIACESAMALSIIISLAKFKGNEMFTNNNMMK